MKWAPKFHCVAVVSVVNGRTRIESCDPEFHDVLRRTLYERAAVDGASLTIDEVLASALLELVGWTS